MKIVALFLILFTSMVHADEPLEAPRSYRTCDAYINFCAFSELGKNTTIYAIKDKFKLTELYQIPGWHRSILISPSGNYVALGYSGLNLVNKNVTAEEEMLSIYRKGTLIREYKLGQLLHSMDSLKPTASHFYWGNIMNIDDYGVELETVEGSVGIVHSSGKVYLPNES